MKDSCRRTYTLQTPIFKTLSQVRAEMHSTAPQPLKATGKLNLFGNTIFLNETGRGIHIIDNSNPASPKNMGFINIPGNVNLAVKGSYLYADSHSDMVVFDISNTSNVVPVKFLNNVMKEKNVYWNSTATNNPDSIKVVVGYNTRDTTVDCQTYDMLVKAQVNCPSCAVANPSLLYSAAAPAQTGVGGSMASFTIVNNYLYAVGSSSLYCLDISNPSSPQQTAVKNMGWGIETIYPFQDKLFMGSRTGMFIYSLNDPANPTAQGSFAHLTFCDPVIADNQYAYVTLRGGTMCNSTNVNELDVLDVNDLSRPALKKTYPLSNPYGLAKDGNLLLVCDGTAGLKLYEASSPASLQLIKQINGLEAYDVIAINKLAVVVAREGLYQFDYSNPANPKQLSKLSISK
ncbi:hypothetical protein GCM10023229_08480 [Flavisolibacter ginsenosidimutans]